MVDTEVLILSRNEFLGLQGLSFPISDYLEDKMRGNRNFSSGKQREKFTKEARINIDSYHDRRNKAIQEYDHLVASGKIQIIDQSRQQEECWLREDTIGKLENLLTSLVN